MKKIIQIIILAVLLLYAVSCSTKTPQTVLTPTDSQIQPQQSSTGEASADSFGNGVSDADSEEKELSSSGLEGSDSGFDDIESM